jgi:hypothetical protein
MNKHPDAELPHHNRPRLTVLTEAEFETVSGGRGSAQCSVAVKNAGGNSATRGGAALARNIGLDPGAVTRFSPGS